MNPHLRVAFLLLFLIGGCAGYKELEPDPPLLPQERGYIELRDDDENFELDKEGKYFIKFPPPPVDLFYLVLVNNQKSVLGTSFTDFFDGDDKSIVHIDDDEASDNSVSAYPINRAAQSYYWLIQSVPYDLQLDLQYRYVPQWRFTFDNEYARFQQILSSYSVDRSTYNSINVSFNADRFDFLREMAQVDERNIRITSMMDELLAIEKIFPEHIAAAGDTSYASYLDLREKVRRELAFQKLYSDILNLFQKERATRGDVAGFVAAVPYFSGILSATGLYSPGVRSKASQLLVGRLSEVAPYLNLVLINKKDITRIAPAPSADTLRALYRACGQSMPRDTELTLELVGRFNEEVAALKASTASLEALTKLFYSTTEAVPDTFYNDLAIKADAYRRLVPRSRSSQIPRYANYGCVRMLEREVTNANNMAMDLQSIYHHSVEIDRQIRLKSWPVAEMSLRELHDTPLASYSAEIQGQRQMLVQTFEDSIFQGVKTASHKRINAFIQAHAMSIDTVASLYADSSFLPVYRLTFSSRGSEGVAEKRKQVDGYLETIKHVQFPENSIRSVYRSLTGNTGDRGVEKARAVVEHGKFYKGEDRQVKNLIGECNVEVPKLIEKPKEYRRIYALPVTSNRGGENEYVFRLLLRIESDAEFPVFDVNIKLPKDIASNAGSRQWYESVTINNRAIRNEGRFTITSPSAENNYEVLITPVQMDKGGRNVLEVRFRYPGFKVFEVSAMAQVPIIRKN